MNTHHGQYRVATCFWRESGGVGSTVKYYRRRAEATTVYNDLKRDARFGNSPVFEIKLSRVNYKYPTYHWRNDTNDSHQGERTMKFMIRAVTRTGAKLTEPCPPHLAPREYFAQRVQRAVNRGDESVQLIKICWSGCEHVLDSWVNELSKNVDDGLPIYKYKIHGLRTAQKGPSNRSNDTFYDTEGEALAKAKGYVTHPVNPQTMVIYKAIKIVRVADQPVLIEDVD